MLTFLLVLLFVLFRRRHCVLPLLQEQPMGFPSWRQTVAWHWPLHFSSQHARLLLDLTSTLSYQPVYLFSLKGAIYSISPLLYPFLNLLHLGFHPSLVLMLNLPSMAKCTGCPQDFILLDTLDCPLSTKHCVFTELYSGLISSFCDRWHFISYDASGLYPWPIPTA